MFDRNFNYRKMIMGFKEKYFFKIYKYLCFYLFNMYYFGKYLYMDNKTTYR